MQGTDVGSKHVAASVNITDRQVFHSPGRCSASDLEVLPDTSRRPMPAWRGRTGRRVKARPPHP
jgi:hypothetical protein